MQGVLVRFICFFILGAGGSCVDAASHSSLKKEVIAPDSFVNKSPQLQSADIFKMFEQRQKRLEKVEGLLKDPKPQKTIMDKKLALLMKLYRQQYSTLSAYIKSQGVGLEPKLNMKYRNIIKEMKGLLNDIDQKDAPFLLRYQKAIHCHELFSNLEALIQNGVDVKESSESSVILSRPRQGQATGGTGEIDHAPRKRGALSRKQELENMNPAIVVPASVGKEYGFDKLIEDDGR
jgi:hypothetical protein